MCLTHVIYHQISNKKLYKITDEAGKGGFGTVHRATRASDLLQSEPGMLFALKEIKIKSLAQCADVAEEIEKLWQVKQAARLNIRGHQNLLEIHHVYCGTTPLPHGFYASEVLTLPL